MLSFLFLQSELPREVFRRVEDLFELRRLKNILKKKLKNILSVQKKFLLLHSQTKTERF